MEHVDYREHPNAGQHVASRTETTGYAGDVVRDVSDPAFGPETYADPNGRDVADYTAPQPELKGRGYSLNELGAKPNVMQPNAPEPVAPDPYTGTTIGDWEYMGS